MRGAFALVLFSMLIGVLAYGLMHEPREEIPAAWETMQGLDALEDTDVSALRARMASQPPADRAED